MKNTQTEPLVTYHRIEPEEARRLIKWGIEHGLIGFKPSVELPKGVSATDVRRASLAHLKGREYQIAANLRKIPGDEMMAPYAVSLREELDTVREQVKELEKNDKINQLTGDQSNGRLQTSSEKTPNSMGVRGLF